MIAILRFLGTNCEMDMAHSFDLLHKPYTIVWHKEESLPKDTSLVVIPGGFSYGDYLRSGAIARFAPIMKSVIKYANDGGLVLGICNGFQILSEAGLLPGALLRNKNITFNAKMATLEVASRDNRLLKSYSQNQRINIPIAHADGNYYIDDEGLEKLEQNHQIILRYEYDINGSIDRIAGICNVNKNVFGIMPHPERAVEEVLGSCDGLAMLRDISE